MTDIFCRIGVWQRRGARRTYPIRNYGGMGNRVRCGVDQGCKSIFNLIRIVAGELYCQTTYSLPPLVLVTSAMSPLLASEFSLPSRDVVTGSIRFSKSYGRGKVTDPLLCGIASFITTIC